MFRTVPLSIIRCFSLYTQQWSMLYSLRAGSGRNVLILLSSCQQTCITYTIAVCTVKNSWWWTQQLSETCRDFFQNKFEKLVHLVGFIIRRYLKHKYVCKFNIINLRAHTFYDLVLNSVAVNGKYSLVYLTVSSISLKLVVFSNTMFNSFV